MGGAGLDGARIVHDGAAECRDVATDDCEMATECRDVATDCEHFAAPGGAAHTSQGRWRSDTSNKPVAAGARRFRQLYGESGLRFSEGRASEGARREPDGGRCATPEGRARVPEGSERAGRGSSSRPNRPPVRVRQKEAAPGAVAGRKER